MHGVTALLARQPPLKDRGTRRLFPPRTAAADLCPGSANSVTTLLTLHTPTKDNGLLLCNVLSAAAAGAHEMGLLYAVTVFPLPCPRPHLEVPQQPETRELGSRAGLCEARESPDTATPLFLACTRVFSFLPGRQVPVQLGIPGGCGGEHIASGPHGRPPGGFLALAQKSNNKILK